MAARAEEKERLKGEVLAFVRERDYVTFAALHKRFAGDARAGTEIALPRNRVVWAGLPKPLVDAVLELLEGSQLAALPCHRSAYKRDGRVLDLPVEKVPPEGAHERPHWYPVWLRPIEAVREEEGSG